MVRPSDFSKIDPYDSVARKSEVETIAQNIMIILKRTGNNFRPLPWLEYKAEREKDGNFTGEEKEYFNKVIGYCKSEDMARLFSLNWAAVPVGLEKQETVRSGGRNNGNAITSRL